MASPKACPSTNRPGRPHATWRSSAGCLLVFLALLPLPDRSAWGRFNTVVLDAGHGGHDHGGIPGQRYTEKTFTLDLAHRIVPLLRAAGLCVVLTRHRDAFVALRSRVAIANRVRNGVLVSLHFNSSYRSSSQGCETFYYSSRSASLARTIHAHLRHVVPTDDRGIKKRGYYILRRSRIPAVLVESGFLTNPSEARRIARPSYRQR